MMNTILKEGNEAEVHLQMPGEMCQTMALSNVGTIKIVEMPNSLMSLDTMSFFASAIKLECYYYYLPMFRVDT